MDVSIIFKVIVYFSVTLVVSLLFIIGVVAFYKKKNKTIDLSSLMGMFGCVVVPFAIYYLFIGLISSGFPCMILVMVAWAVSVITIPISYLLSKYLSHLYLTSNIGQNNSQRKIKIIVLTILCISYIILSVPSIIAETVTVKIIDQHGNPVNNASLTFHAERWSCLPRFPVFGAPKTAGIIKSNSQGLITIKPFGKYIRISDISKTNHINDLGQISITKRKSATEPGWYPGWYTNGYDRTHYEPVIINEPYIINLWKYEKTAALVRGKKRLYWLRKEGTQNIPIPLINDLTINITANPEGTRATPLGWIVTLRGGSSGLIESNDTFMYEAPPSGYQSEWVAKFTPGTEEWSYKTQRNFYLNNGQMYGRIKARFWPYYGNDEKAAVAVEYWINPTGTNLVYDREKEIHLPQ